MNCNLSLKLCCDSRFQRVITACSCVFKFIKNAMLKTCVATSLKLISSKFSPLKVLGSPLKPVMWHKKFF